jgi:hypothetical protein
MHRGNSDHMILAGGRKAAVAALTAVTTFVLVAPAAFAGSDIDKDSDRGKLGLIALGVLILIAAIWFFVFRGKEDDSSASDESSSSDAPTSGEA